MSELLSQSGKFRMQTTDTETVINIDGVIGSYDFWGDYSAAKMREDLKNATGSTVCVIINSPGGEVFQGIAIHDALRASGKKIITKASGVAASIASVIFLAGDEREVTDGSFVMIHNALCWACGNASELRKLADDLDKFSGAIADIYAKVTGSDPGQIKTWMDAETWFTAAECKSNGFATTAATDAPAAFATSPFSRVFAAYKNTPKALLSAPTAGNEDKPKNTPAMSKENQPAGGDKPRAEVTTEAWDALITRVAALETASADHEKRMKAIEDEETTEDTPAAKARADEIKALRVDIDAIKAVTPARAAILPGAKADTPGVAKAVKDMNLAELNKHYASLPTGEKQRFYAEHIKPKL